MSARGNIRQPQPDVRFARIDSPMASCRDEKEETMLSGNNQAIRATLRGTAALALMAGLGMGLTGCSISIGGGSGSGSGDSGQQPAQTQGQANGGNGGQSASAPTTTGGADSAATSASGGSANSQATEIQTAGHWEIAAVWRGNQKLDLASEGMDGWYLDFYDGGYVVVHTSTGSYVSDYTSSGKTGTIKGDPSLSDSSHYDEAFEIDSTSDGSSLAMKVNYVEISPDSFRVYKRVGNAPDFASRSDIKPEVNRSRTLYLDCDYIKENDRDNRLWINFSSEAIDSCFSKLKCVELATGIDESQNYMYVISILYPSYQLTI